jgi:hypothetical protein
MAGKLKCILMIPMHSAANLRMASLLLLMRVDLIRVLRIVTNIPKEADPVAPLSNISDRKAEIPYAG